MSSMPSFTIGVEEEYQIVDPETRELRSHSVQLLEVGKPILHELLQPELHQSIVEIGTPICATPAEAKAELIRLRQAVMALAARDGLKIAAAGTHPFSQWSEQEITPKERYQVIKDDLQFLAQRMLIFGTHVHIGVDDPDAAIDVFNAARYFLPHILCLSTSSPFWVGRETGLKSYRSIVFRNLHRSGIPPVFNSRADFQRTVDTLVKTSCIPDGSKIYWDLRPHHRFPTLEFRIADCCTRVEEAACVAALVQAVVAKMWKLRRDGRPMPQFSSVLIEENKWRAVRQGLDGQLVDFEREEERPARELIRELLSSLGDVVDELGSRDEIEYAYQILENGSSADRQLAIYQRTNDHKAVVDHLIAETEEGVK